MTKDVINKTCKLGMKIYVEEDKWDQCGELSLKKCCDKMMKVFISVKELSLENLNTSDVP